MKSIKIIILSMTLFISHVFADSGAKEQLIQMASRDIHGMKNIITGLFGILCMLWFWEGLVLAFFKNRYDESITTVFQILGYTAVFRVIMEASGTGSVEFCFI